MDDIHVVDESGEVVESPDLEKGWVEEVCTIEDDGSLTVIKRIYHPYTEEELEQIEAKERQDVLMEQVAAFFPDGKDQMQQEIDDATASSGADPQLQALARMQVMTMDLSPYNASEVIAIRDYWPEWEVGKAYKQNDCFTYDSKYWRASKDLTSQEIYPPGTSESLYYEVQLADDGIIVYRTCHGAYDEVKAGELCHYPNADSPVYRAKVDTAYDPDTVPANWELVPDAT